MKNGAMNVNELDLFYDRYVEHPNDGDHSYSGHFDILHWRDLKQDLSACALLQRKPFYKIALLKGNASYHCNNTDIPITDYTIVFTDPLTRTAFKTVDEKFSGIYCICTDSFLRGTAKVNLRRWPVFRERNVFSKALTKIEYDYLSLLFSSMEDEIETDYPFKEQIIRGRIFDIIHYVQKMLPKDEIIYDKNEDTLDEQFFKQLETAFFSISPEKPLVGKTPAYFAEQVHCSVDLLNQTLKKASGKTTQQLIHERIIDEAGVLLRHSNYSIKEIAWMLHFQETAHFLNFYKKHTGTTPKEYRNS
jgi:AraC-type DNA-binding domain-containing proteins